ncbi:MAG: hypothetical protein NTU54_04480 [Candidatus Omnitrophica bacterium]|nr:hypothetical protein [Candidatus Omnitrophota bacterium]
MKRALFFGIIGGIILLRFAGAEETANGSEKAAAPQEKISLDLKGIDINEVFRLLSLKMGISIVPTKNVSGRVNLLLNNLTFQDALDVLLVSQDLACERKEGIINVMTSADYERLYGRKYNEKRKFRSFKLLYAKPSAVFSALQQVKSDVGKIIVDEGTGTFFLLDNSENLDLMEKTARDLDLPPQTEIFDLQYSKAEDMKTHLASVITTGPGEVLADVRSTKVVVSDLPGKMKKIEKIIKAFDEENKEVLIDAKVIEITLKQENQRQINWEKILRSIRNLDFKGTYPVSPSFSASPSLSTNNQQISVGTLSNDDFTATVNFLQTLGATRIVSQPRIVVQNNQEAKIMVGSREAYVLQTLSQSKSSTVNGEDVTFIDVGVKLSVMPTIHPDGFITLKIKPEVSSVRETLTTTLGSKVPIVETSEVETVLNVKDGITILLGGLVKEDKRKDTSGLPVLARIPLLGVFFGSRADLKKRTEMVVFITPHIITGNKNFDKQELEGSESVKLLPEEVTAASVYAAKQDEELVQINIQEKIKGPKEY